VLLTAPSSVELVAHGLEELVEGLFVTAELEYLALRKTLNLALYLAQLVHHVLLTLICLHALTVDEAAFELINVDIQVINVPVFVVQNLLYLLRKRTWTPTEAIFAAGCLEMRDRWIYIIY